MNTKRLCQIAAVALAGALTACGGAGSAKSAAEAADTVVRRYVGTLPAADCPGIVFDVTLAAPADSVSGDFTLSMTYLEAEDGKDLTVDSRGRWETATGIAGDPSAVYYRLVEPGTRPDTTNFLYMGDSIVLLGAGLQRIESGLNYTLQLQK